MRSFYSLPLLAAGALALMSFSTKPTSSTPEQPFLFQPVSSFTLQQAQEEQWVTIVDEDFSGLTKGTEELPDTESLLDPKTGDVTEANLNKFKSYNTGDDTEYARTWGGAQLFEAGGCIAAVNGGFLCTPTGDYSGNLKFTCRMKAIKGQNLEAIGSTVDLILMRGTVLTVFERTTCTLTDEWQTFTFEAYYGWPRDCLVQFFAPGNLSYLIDDIKIEHEGGTVETPKALPPTDLKDNGFTACWRAIPNADNYLLSVYKKTPNPETIDINESFETINGLDFKNTWIDDMTTIMPEGWNISVGVVMDYEEPRVARDIYNSANEADKQYIYDGNRAICFDMEGDYLETPPLKYPIKEFVCYLKADCTYLTKDQKSGTKIYIDAYTDGTWIEWKYAQMENLRQMGGEWAKIDFTKELSLLNNIQQIRLRIVRDPQNMDFSRLAVDGIKIVAPGTPLNEYIFSDRKIPTNNVDPETGELRSIVTDLDPEIDYFYTVKATKGNRQSAPSNEIEAFDVSNPTALPATNVSETGYTANWECHSKVDFFKISQILTFIADKDLPDYVILDEDFSKISSTGTAENPERGEYNTTEVPIDKYTKIPGWTATSYCLGNGMLGGMPAPEGDNTGIIAGVIQTPFMDLSHGTGTCKVTMRVYAEEGDLVNVLGVDNMLTLYSCVFPKTGWQEVEFELMSSNEKEQLAIYSNNYSWFMLDSFKVTHSLSKGDKMTMSTGVQTVMDKNARSAQMENAYFEPEKKTGYYVEAYRIYHGMVNDVWQSPASNLIEIQNGDAIQSVDSSNNSTVIIAKEGAVEVTLPENADIEVYAVDGRLVNKTAGISGTNMITLESGLYIVRAGSKKAKVIVR